MTRRVEPSHPGRTLRIAGMATAGAGLVALAVGKRAEKRMFIGTGLGAAFIAGGAVLYYFGHAARERAESEPEGITAAPMVDGDGFGFAVSGRF